MSPKTVNLALQGGGSHGAYTWGALDAFAEDERIEISAISGASAGAMNAVVFASGMSEGGRERARAKLEDFWLSVSSEGSLTTFQRRWVDKALNAWGGLWPASRWIDAWTETAIGLLSPYEFNPFNINPLRAHLEAVVDFERLRAGAETKLFVAATNVRTGRGEIFRRDILTVDHVMASACLPQLFQAVVIDGQPYWDGGFAGNPPLWPLFYETQCRDAIIVQINPIEREATPRLPAEIADRVDEITFNASLLAELRATDFVAPPDPLGACSTAMNTARSGCIASAAPASSNPSTRRASRTSRGRSSSNCATSAAPTPRRGLRSISIRSAPKARSTSTRPCSASP